MPPSWYILWKPIESNISPAFLERTPVEQYKIILVCLSRFLDKMLSFKTCNGIFIALGIWPLLNSSGVLTSMINAVEEGVDKICCTSVEEIGLYALTLYVGITKIVVNINANKV